MVETPTRGFAASLTHDGRLLDVILDAGKGNVIDRAAIGSLREILGRYGSEPHLCAIRLDHAGKHFSFGASVEEHTAELVRAMLPEFHELARELLALDVPMLACVRGHCLGGGLELVALADRVFAHPGAHFGQPEIALGVFAPIGSALLPRLVGPHRAADLLLSGRSIAAEEARDIGLVGHLAEDPAAAALHYAEEHLLPKSARALRLATAAARRAWRPGFLADIEALEALYLGELMRTRDANEGIAAFLEKREPGWEDA